MLNLQVGSFRLRYDGIQWTVTETKVAEKGASAGQERDTDHGYHGRLAHALLDVFDRLQGTEDAGSVEALLRATETHARAIVAAAADADRQLSAMRHGEA